MELEKEQTQAKGGFVQDVTTEEKPAQFDQLMAFLDADTYEEKLEILYRMQLDLNDYLIDTMAVSLDVVVPEGDIDERYRQLKSCIQAKQKYEINRFR